MSRTWEEPPKRRSPMDSGNNGTWIEKLIKARQAKKAAKQAKPPKGKKK